MSRDGKAVVAAFWESLYAPDRPRSRTFFDADSTSDLSWMVDVTAEI
ncbi:MAG TPA: hypothetical protein VNW94_10365 [Streptosporangiaceae bacterium]|nr:hypothetical protein [Streptosporangiaceae bacterium]